MIGLAAILILIVAIFIAKSGFSEAANIRKNAELESPLHPYWLGFLAYAAFLAAMSFLSIMLCFAGKKGLYVLEFMGGVLLGGFVFQLFALIILSFFEEKFLFTKAALKTGMLFLVIYVFMFINPLRKVLGITTHY